MKRWITRLVVLLLLGAIVNVAVAWACVVLLIGRTESNLEVHEGRDGSKEAWSVTRAWGFEHVQATFLFDGWFSRGIDVEARPRHDWSTMRSGSQDQVDRLVDAEVWAEAAAGWPFLCLGYRVSLLGSNDQALAIEYYWGLPIKRETEIPFPDNIGLVLPLRPIPWGFFADASIYTLLCFVLWRGSAFACRAWRYHRGRCPRCAYNLRSGFSAGCPECGWRRESEV